MTYLPGISPRRAAPSPHITCSPVVTWKELHPTQGVEIFSRRSLDQTPQALPGGSPRPLTPFLWNAAGSVLPCPMQSRHAPRCQGFRKQQSRGPDWQESWGQWCQLRSAHWLVHGNKAPFYWEPRPPAKDQCGLCGHHSCESTVGRASLLLILTRGIFPAPQRLSEWGQGAGGRERGTGRKMLMGEGERLFLDP